MGKHEMYKTERELIMLPFELRSIGGNQGRGENCSDLSTDNFLESEFDSTFQKRKHLLPLIQVSKPKISPRCLSSEYGAQKRCLFSKRAFCEELKK